MNFKIGQRVVCIKDVKWDLYVDERAPDYLEVVTIREIYWWENEWCLLFNEYKNPCNYPDGSECVFAAHCFAPLSERTEESEAFAENLITQLETEVETLEWLHK